MIKKSALFLSVLLLLSCTKEGSVFKTLPAKKAGVSFQNSLQADEDMNILDYLYFYNGGGLAVGDINQDGLPDLFFSGNQVKNKLYLNQGGLRFEDISESAGVAGNSDWNTGVVMGDVNGDGLLDIYVCAVVGINGMDGHNELFINQGDNTFKEQAAAYGLDLDTYSSSAAFLDYDLDGDLDLYILNHAVHTQDSFGKASLREKRNYETGDRLMRNDGDRFTDVSEEAGIYGGVNGYGLGLAVADFNRDGLPDIYVGNDFHEDDYFYINQGDGTFKEQLRDYFGHTSRFSMGNDVADINHDGWPDMISLDMLPQDERVLKSSEGDDNIQTQQMRTEQFGYHYQFTRNMLYVNQPGYQFTESALASGVAATDWSWSALFGDYDQDGHQDLFISNGIPKRPNDLDYIKFISSEQIRSKIDNTSLIDQEALNLMPKGTIHNYVFRGDGNTGFKDESGTWTVKDTLVSGASAYADLDGDGDLDLITNNLNAPPSFYINKTDQKANYLQLDLQFPGKNTYALGAKVFVYHDGKMQFKEHYTVRGFQASSEPLLHFGLGSTTQVDSLRIIWPDQQSQLMTNIAVNQKLKISPENASPFDYQRLQPKRDPLFQKVKDNLGIDFVHQEDRYQDFLRQKLIPFEFSDRGPALAVGDLNQDGKTDLYFGGSKRIAAQVYWQQDTAYAKADIQNYPMLNVVLQDSINEEVAAVLEDFNGDGKADLLIGTGGADFYGQAEPLLDAYFIAKDSSFVKQNLPPYFENASVLAPFDYDGDGDLDLFVGNQMVTGDYGKLPQAYLLKNTKGQFEVDDTNPMGQLGMVTDAIWSDFNGDGTTDLIIVGEWMKPLFYENQNGKLKPVDKLDQGHHGLWQSIIAFDIDSDGDDDYLLGNWGENSKFQASEKAPLRMYYHDFDQNGQTETIVASAKEGNYYPIEGLDGLSEQLVFLRKKYTRYADFAGQTVEELLTEEQLEGSTVLTVSNLRSGYLKNEAGNFTFVPFDRDLQVSPIMAFTKFDFDGDGKTEVLAGGNYFGVKPYHGRLDAFSGALIESTQDIKPGFEMGLDFAQKSIRHLEIISLNNQNYLLAVFNNAAAEVYTIKKTN
ncbi:VCBS repeat-containing protein [Croceiramulus getboli]|nr:VCBS repeat-containing protein [Flavobacteriaceae bacterium YJPT1-3]